MQILFTVYDNYRQNTDNFQPTYLTKEIVSCKQTNLKPDLQVKMQVDHDQAELQADLKEEQLDDQDIVLYFYNVPED